MHTKTVTLSRSLAIIFAAVFLISAGVVASDYATANKDIATAGTNSDSVSLIETESDYQPSNYTVVTSVSGAISSAQEQGALFVVTPEGRVVHQEHRYNIYDDVDPHPKEEATLTFASAKKLSGEDCKRFDDSPCTLNFIEQLNFSTGERERLYSEKTAGVANTRWHDADRINATHFAIADIAQERLIIVNTETNSITYEWRMEEAFDRNSSGGDAGGDWAHLNDVEQLRDGTFMLSPRNHDQVIFVDPDEGLLENRTLGEDGNYEILYEQHNPDYLYGPNGTNSVVVADSQNNRIVEYERADGEWSRTWSWSDDNLRWPRDADRLPNGHTLIADTGGGRIVEVAPDGEVVWGISVKGNYEAERLGTGDESEGGHPMSSVRSNNRPVSGDAVVEIPPKLRLAINGALFVAPGWATVSTILAAIGGAASAMCLCVISMVKIKQATIWR